MASTRFPLGSRLPALGFASLVLTVPLVLGLAGCSSNGAATKDVTITSCTADPSGGRPSAVGTIDNHSSKASTYVVGINFFDSANNKVSQGADTVGKVESGATATFHVQGLASAKGPLSCTVGTVTRTVAP